jgi:hypothetical protein
MLYYIHSIFFIFFFILRYVLRDFHTLGKRVVLLGENYVVFERSLLVMYYNGIVKCFLKRLLVFYEIFGLSA